MLGFIKRLGVDGWLWLGWRLGCGEAAKRGWRRGEKKVEDGRKRRVNAAMCCWGLEFSTVCWCFGGLLDFCLFHVKRVLLLFLLGYFVFVLVLVLMCMFDC